MNDSSNMPQKVLHSVITLMAAHSVGTYSKVIGGASELPQHSVSIAITGTVAGVVTVRARPVNGGGFTKVGIESIDLAADSLLCWSITGFFDAWALIVETGITGTGAGAQLIVGSCTNGL